MTGERDFQDQPDQLQFGAVAVDAAPDSGSAVAAVEPAGAMITPYAQEMLDTQPFRNYELKSCLASSQTSAVFKAKDMGMERTVALKAMRPWPGRDGAVEEFFSLAGSIARLRSAYAPRGCDAGRAGKDFYLAYAFVDGDTLADRLARRKTGRLTEKESLRVAGAVAAALDDLFSHGHPHGNVRLSNIVLADGGKVVLTDIAYAWKLAWPSDAEAFAAKPECLPPELIEGDLNIDIRGDLYSLGALWYQALLGRPVFQGSTGAETVRMHVEAQPIPPRELDPKLLAATSKLILWLLEKDRDARPRTPKEFLRKLATHPLLTEERETAGNDGNDSAGDDESRQAEAEPVDSAESDETAEKVAPEEDRFADGGTSGLFAGSFGTESNH